MKRAVVAGAFLSFAYFSLAYYFKISHVEDVPRRADIAVIHRIMKTATPGTFYAQVWLPTYATKAVVYENGVSIGKANAVYDDPGRPWVFVGRRWKLVEFNTKGEAARRWITFSGSAATMSERR
jgi:hypothetical protein